MNNEKKAQQPERKKESTSLLEKIRRRTGLLVGIVGLALAIFILESLLGSGRSIFGSDEYTSMGTINGHKIDRNDFLNRLENQMNNYRQRNGGREVDDQVRSQAIDGILQQYVVEYVMKPQFEKAGITVGEDEVYQNVVVNPAQSVVQNLTDPNTGKVNEQFARPDGSLDLNKWRQAVQNVTGESEMAVRQMEDMVKSSLYFNKFRNLVNKGLYVTRAEAEFQAKERTTALNITIADKQFESIPDSTVKITDEDLQKYYNDHTYEFQATDASRRIEYVAFNVTPSREDVDAIQKDAQRIADEFKGKSMSEDSALMAQENEGGAVMVQSLNRKMVPIRDSSFYTAPAGTVFGPYNEGNSFKIYKLEAINSIADSARVRHILIGTSDPQTQQPKRSMQQAKHEADSLLALLKEHKVSFDTLVKTVSDDMGSKTNGGDYGWFDENKGFVEPFKNAGLMGTKGNISVVETQFGYHIIEVLDVSKSHHMSYRIAQISKPIVPSDETNQKAFAQASQFGGENNTADLFDKGVKDQKLVPRMAELHEGEYSAPGLEGGKDLVKWVFTAEKGDVGVFSLNGKHVVAKVTSIRDKGTLKLDDVRNEVTMKVREQKKGEMLLEEFRKAGDTKDVEALAQKLGIKAVNQEKLIVVGGNINGVGHDDIVAGTAAGTKTGAVTKPTVGETCVFVLAVKDRTTEGPKPDIAQQQKEIMQQMTGRSDYEVFNALKEMSDIDFHKSRID